MYIETMIKTHRNREKSGTMFPGISDEDVTVLWKFRIFIIYSWIGRYGYFIPLNKEATVANLRRSSLCTGAAFRPKFRWVGTTMVGIFCTHCQHSQLEQKKSLPSLWASLVEDFIILIVLRLWGPWHHHANNTHSLRISLAQGFRCFPQWDKINLTNK